MANLFNRLGQLGVGLAIAGSVASSALYNGKSHRRPYLSRSICLPSASLYIYLYIYIRPCGNICKINTHNVTNGFVYSRWWSPSGHLRSVPGHQGIGCRRRHPFHHSVGPAAHSLRHSFSAPKRSSRYWQQGSAKRQHHTAYSLPTQARPAAQDLHHSGS